MRGNRFLHVASELESHHGEEWDRTHIGRLYYGVYLEYRQLAEDYLGFSRLNLAREHRVIAELLQSLDEEAANDLRNLRILRNQADYDLNVSPEEIADRLSSAFLLAESMIQKLEALKLDLKRP